MQPARRLSSCGSTNVVLDICTMRRLALHPVVCINHRGTFEARDTVERRHQVECKVRALKLGKVCFAL